MPPPNVAGHQPKKITMNKFGGGITNFGSNYGARAQQPGWSPQPSIYSQQYTPQLSTQEREGTASQYQQQVIIYGSRVRIDSQESRRLYPFYMTVGTRILVFWRAE